MPIKGSLLGKGSEGGCYERGKKGHDEVKKIKIIPTGTAEATCKKLVYLAQNTVYLAKNTCDAGSVYAQQQ